MNSLFFAYLMRVVCLLLAVVLWPLAFLAFVLVGERPGRRLVGKEVVSG